MALVGKKSPDLARSGRDAEPLLYTSFSVLLVAAAMGSLALLLWPTALTYSEPRPETSKAGGGVSETAAQSLASKIAILSNPGSAVSLHPITITEAEANSYLKYRGHEFLPSAVQNPEMHISSHRVYASAEVDFNELDQADAQTDDWGAKIIALIFKGKQRVMAAGRLDTGSGQGKVTIESLSVGTTSIPAGFAQVLVQSYVERRYKIDLSKPFPLPENVTQIVLGNGLATLYRSPGRSRGNYETRPSPP